MFVKKCENTWDAPFKIINLRSFPVKTGSVESETSSKKDHFSANTNSSSVTYLFENVSMYLQITKNVYINFYFFNKSTHLLQCSRSVEITKNILFLKIYREK
jgi:hypothetical protein